MGARRPRLAVHTCNRLEPLLDELGGRLAADPLPPLEAEVVVVQSQGMRRWVTLGLARRNGLAASLSMPFPGAFARHLARRAAGVPRDEADPFDRETLTFRVHGALGRLPASRPFDPLRRYVDGPDGERKRYQLACRLAAHFDDYQLYRPDLLAGWEADPPALAGLKHEEWQAALWRELVAESGGAHLGRRLTELIGRLRRGEPVEGVPRRLSLFGASSLPPAVVELLAALAHEVPVDVSVVVPTTEYWGDDLTAREARHIARQAPDGPDALLEAGHPLLAAFGRQGRDLLRLLLDADPDGGALDPLPPVRPGRATALACLQSDVLELVRRGPEDEPPVELREADRSLTLHLCHSPLREMEVVADQILAAFDEDPTLRPDEVLVLVPDVVAYEPFVRAAFERPRLEGGPPRLPISIADRPVTREQPLTAALLRLLALGGSRLGRSELLALLEAPPVRRRFGIALEDVPMLERWVDAAAIRWGADGEHRCRVFDVPADEANSWRLGLDRLLLGYATGEVEALVGGLLPHAEATTARAELLGRLATFVDTVVELEAELRRPRPLGGWADLLRSALTRLAQVSGEGEEGAVATIAAALAALEAGQRWSPGPVPLEVVVDHLSAAFGDDSLGAGFVTGRITVCALKPMRTIPARVVAVAGLSDGAFPRLERPQPFDCMAQRPRRGDRSVREDDRALFLETLLAVEGRLVLTYVGRSQRTNELLAPSVCLADLLDVVDGTFGTASGEPARKRIVVDHPLQPFGPSYFRGEGPLFSYSTEDLEACRAGASPEPPPPFAPAGQLLAVEPPETVALDDLISFWRNPARAFCARGLGLRLPNAAERLEDVEPFAVGRLEAYGLLGRLLARRLRGEDDLDEEHALVAQLGTLPPGSLGALEHRRHAARLGGLVARLAGRAFEPPAVLRVEDRAAGFVLTGRLDGLAGPERLQFRAWEIAGRDLLEAWLTGLAMAAAAAGPDARRPTLVLGLSGAVRLHPPEEPGRLLRLLVEGYREGLRRPLPVFPKASRAFVDALRKAGKRAGTTPDPTGAALRAFMGSVWEGGDAADPYVALAFRGRDPFADELEGFETWSRHLWEPLLDHAEEVTS